MQLKTLAIKGRLFNGLGLTQAVKLGTGCCRNSKSWRSKQIVRSKIF